MTGPRREAPPPASRGAISFDDIVGGEVDSSRVETAAPGPGGKLPLTPEMLLERPSGDVFALSQNVAMGWSPESLSGREVLILSTQGGLRLPDGSPLALGYHTGHWEVGLLAEAAAREVRHRGAIPFAGSCTDPCDGRSQGTPAMMDSLPYRNDAAIVLRRLIRSLPNRAGVLGIGTCDKGLPAMMIALAGFPDLPVVIVPGGVSLPPRKGEDAGRIQSIGVRFAHGEIGLDEASVLGCRACASPGGGCQFLGTAATSQVIAEALGLAIPHSALSPSGQDIWLDMGRRSARALLSLEERGIRSRDVLTEGALRNAMVVHAAFGGSTNLLLHVPAIVHAAGLRRPGIEDWVEVNRRVPRIVDVLPNGPTGHPTVRVFLAGGVPEVMLHLRDAGLLELDALTATGEPLRGVLEWWERSERRTNVRARLREADGVEPGDVILSPAAAAERGLASTVVFPRGNLAPEGSVVKATAIDPSVVGPDGVFSMVGPARVFTRETDAVRALKSRDQGAVRPGDVMVLICRGPLGAGMEEIFQVTAALRYLSFGKSIAVITDARFSGVSTGACIGHVGPEALAGGPIGKLRDGDMIRIRVDRRRLEGSVDIVGEDRRASDPKAGTAILERRRPREDLAPDPLMSPDTRLWALLQSASGGTWGGCVYDLESIRSAFGSRDGQGGE